MVFVLGKSNNNSVHSLQGGFNELCLLSVCLKSIGSLKFRIFPLEMTYNFFFAELISHELK